MDEKTIKEALLKGERVLLECKYIYKLYMV
jgi:hypothetical protein